MAEFLTSTNFWGILLKVLLTALLSAAIGLVCTLIGKLIAKSKNSKLKKHARIAVRAAEMKFPNEGKKMGPEKMAYVMDYLAITFPKIRSNQYLYNIAEAAVYELNNQDIKKEAEQLFKDKYGELPSEDLEEAVQEEVSETTTNSSKKAETVSESNVITNKTEKILTEFNLKSF